MNRDKLSKNLPILSEANDMTLKESFNLLLTRDIISSAFLKTVHFEPFFTLKQVIRQTPVSKNGSQNKY